MGTIILSEAQKIQREQGAAGNITIHADMTGGMRNASMMMLGVMRLLHFSGLQMGKILYSNFSFNRKINFVEDSQDVYRFFDLVAGATEFAKYGSVEKLADGNTQLVMQPQPLSEDDRAPLLSLSFMPVAANMLRNALGMKNAGITTATAVMQQDMSGMVSAITQRVLERVLPAMTATSGSQEAKQPLYVGTLIADERGLRTLKRQLDLIDAAERR